MANREQRGNKEKRKPKKDAKAAKAPPAPLLGAGSKPSDPKKK